MALPFLGPFTVKTGPVVKKPDITPVEAWEEITGAYLRPLLVRKAQEAKVLTGVDFNVSDQTFNAFAACLLGMGIVGLRIEKFGFSNPDRSELSLLGNDYLRGHFTHEKFQTAKKLYVANQAELTVCFNDMARPGNLVNPDR